MGGFLPFSVFFGQASFPQVALWKAVKSVENFVDYAENPYFVDFIRLFSCIYSFYMWKTFHNSVEKGCGKTERKSLLPQSLQNLLIFGAKSVIIV